MQVVVLGTGRSGTNMILETLRGNDIFIPSISVEDKHVFNRGGIIYPDYYLTKSDIEYTPWAMFANAMNLNLDMKIIWAIRDPRDTVLSKLYRGRQSEYWAYDATTWGCIGTMNMAFGFFLMLTSTYSERVYAVRMEDMLLNQEEVVKHMCGWIGIEYKDDMKYFYTRMREKSKGYTNIDLGEIGKYKRLDTIYDGFFKDKHEEVDLIFNNIKYITQFFGYKL